MQHDTPLVLSEKVNRVSQIASSQVYTNEESAFNVPRVTKRFMWARLFEDAWTTSSFKILICKHDRSHI